jgi:hypothetical protein
MPAAGDAIGHCRQRWRPADDPPIVDIKTEHGAGYILLAAAVERPSPRT